MTAINHTAPKTIPPVAYTPEQIKEQEKVITVAVGGVMISGYLGYFTAQLFTKYGICLNKILPSSIQKIIEINTDILNVLKSPIALLPSSLIDPANIIIAAPIVEEFEVRFLFQEVLLRRLPKMILTKYAPKYTHLVEATPAKIARVALSTLLFGLMHIARAEDHSNKCLGSNYGFTVLGLGALYGFGTEKTGSVGRSMLAHSVINLFAYIAGNVQLTPWK